MEAVKQIPEQKKLGFFAKRKYHSILKEIYGPAPDQYRVYNMTKRWLARKYPKKAAEIAGRLITDTNNLGIIKAAQLSEYLVDKGKVESSDKIATMIEGAAIEGLYVPKDAWETVRRVRDKIHTLKHRSD